MTDDKKLLILDDDVKVGKTIALIARKVGFSARASTDPEEFFDTVASWVPSRILIDLAMPKLDGVEVLRRLSEQQCRAGIILASGLGARVLDSARRAGGERKLHILGCLSKPFKADSLRRLLDTSIGFNAGTGSKQAYGGRYVIDESEIIQAIQDKQFFLYFQPKISLRTGDVHAFEALVRWRHPVHGMIQPGDFISRIEALGKIHELTCQLFEGALDWLQEISREHQITLEFNISPDSLQNLNLVDYFSNECGKRRINPNLVAFEVTETSAIYDFSTAVDVLTRLRIKGFQLAIDDFGIGYSSMHQLSRLPFSEIKIDQSFVMPLTTSNEARQIVESIISLAHKLGMTTVAEGIEDQETLLLLRKIGCDIAQGYHISRPMPSDLVRQWLDQYRGSVYT